MTSRRPLRRFLVGENNAFAGTVAKADDSFAVIETPVRSLRAATRRL